MARFRSIFGKLFRALGDWLSDRTPQRSSLEYDAQQMLQGLDLKADATSFAMARADDLHEKLQAEVENCESLDREAAKFLSEDHEQEAERCVALRLQSAKVIAELQAKYEAAQREAEQLAGGFIQKRQEVEAKVAVIPELQEDIRINQMQEKIERAAAQFSLDSAERSFDQAVREISIRKKQLVNRQLLTADPNAELDRRIRKSIEQREIDHAMEALRQRVQAGAVIDAEYAVVEDDPVAAARKMLTAPRYSGILPALIGAKAKVPLKRPS